MYVYVVGQLTVPDIVCVCVLNSNRNNVLIAIFLLVHILSKPSELYFHNIEPQKEQHYDLNKLPKYEIEVCHNYYIVC